MRKSGCREQVDAVEKIRECIYTTIAVQDAKATDNVVSESERCEAVNSDLHTTVDVNRLHWVPGLKSEYDAARDHSASLSTYVMTLTDGSLQWLHHWGRKKRGLIGPAGGNELFWVSWWALFGRVL